MKKMILSMAMLFAMSSNLFANETMLANVDNVEKYVMRVNASLAKALELEKDQIDVTDILMKDFERSTEFASSMEGEARDTLMGNAIKMNIRNMHYVLNRSQYKKYLRILNATVVNRGIDVSKVSSK